MEAIPDGPGDGASERAYDGPRPRAVDEIPRRLRPRERLQRRGPSALTAGELLALVIGETRSKVPVRVLAERLVHRYGIAGLGKLESCHWRSVPGIGAVSAARIAAAIELGRRAWRKEESDRPRIARPGHAFEQVRQIGRAKKEHLVGLYLDSQNGLVHRETISIGSLNTTRTHPREILFPAVAHLALGFILCHNHPSGCLEISPEDGEFTRSVQRAGELMGIELYDHLIVAGNRYISLRERGVL